MDKKAANGEQFNIPGIGRMSLRWHDIVHLHLEKFISKPVGESSRLLVINLWVGSSCRASLSTARSWSPHAVRLTERLVKA